MPEYGKLKKRVWQIVQNADAGDGSSRVFDIAILTLIFLNIFAVILETVDYVYRSFASFFHYFELFSVIVFTAEYLVRIWAGTADKRFQHPILGRLRLIFTPLMLIDLLAIAPFYIALVGDFRAVRVLRLFRIFRVIKLARYSKALQTLGKVMNSKREELLVAVFVLLLLLVLSSSLMFYVENDDQPSAFGSIPEAMWWSVATLTTVGYGDVHPVTPLGKFLASIIAVLGIGLFALPTGILGSGFVEEMQREKREKIVCPHCGKDFHD